MGVLERKDYMVIGGLLLTPFLVASLTYVFESLAMAIMIWTGRWIQVPSVIAGVVVIYLAQKMWSGDLGRALTLTGIGFAAIFISWTPHEIWHLQFSPGWFGISPGSWLGIYHGLTISMSALITYGYYLIWHTGKTGGGSSGS